MPRFLSLFALVVSIGAASADIGPPPGIKRIPVEGKITTEKEFPDYVFFVINNSGETVTELKVEPKTPGTFKPVGRFHGAEVVAVPKDAVKAFPGEKELHAAVARGKVAGLVKSKVVFFSTTDVKEADPRKVAVEEYKLTKVDAKGIVLEAIKAAPKTAPKNAPDDEPEEMSSVAPKNGMVVSGIAAFLGIALAGLWLVRRFK